MKEYTAAIAAASVGVKIPPYIPPITITTSIRPQNASLKETQTSRADARGMVGKFFARAVT